MIGFFRRTRKKFADSNQIFKYSRYAVGEIVLVMVGILLALQVNNWNSSRLERNEATSYLVRLSEDLKTDNKYLLSEKENAVRESDSLGLFLALMYEEQTSRYDFLRLLRLADWNPRNIHIQDNTFAEMNNSGKYDLIENNELKTAIIDYYKTRDFAYEHIEVTTEHGFKMFMQLYPELTRYYNYEALKQHDIFKIDDWGWINRADDLRFKTLAACVSHFRYKAELWKGYCQILHDKATKILMLIEAQLIND